MCELDNTLRLLYQIFTQMVTYEFEVPIKYNHWHDRPSAAAARQETASLGRKPLNVFHCIEFFAYY